jgi:transposase
VSIAAPLVLRAGDQPRLAAMARSQTVTAAAAQRARIVLLAADGVPNAEIARRLGVTRPTVVGWRRRYLESGIAGLSDLDRSGRPASIEEADVVIATLTKPPESLGVTHWSARLLADQLGISFASVARIWRKWNLQPWRIETFKFSTDPELDAKVRDVVALYLNPPDKAIVLSIDEKSQIQALNRTAPILPLRPGLPEKATHDHVRHGTTTLFAALEVATGKITDACHPRHTHLEFLAFLKQVAKAYPRVTLHIVCDNYGTHKTPEGDQLAGKQPADHHALHTHLRIVAEHGGDLLRHHHPTTHPPRHLHLGRGPHRRHRGLHRRLEPTLPPLRLDQNRRRHPDQSPP